jgi:hypothetical protein
MRKALLLFSIAAFVAVGAPIASANVLSSLLAVNDTDDSLTDDSLGFIVDTDDSGGLPDPGDVAFGIAWLDDINGIIAPDPRAVAGRAYIVYSVEFVTIDSTTGAATYQPTTVVGYTLSDILGVAVDDDSVAAIVERTGAPTAADPFFPKVDITNNDYKFGNNTFANATPAEMIDDINGSDADGLMSAADFLFAVGILDSVDFFETGDLDFNAGIAKWQIDVTAGLSITDPGSLNPLNFQPLVTNNLYEAAVLSATQTLEGGDSTTLPEFNDDGYIRTYDAGNYIVNYVPEPTSMTALAGLGLVGLGWVVRRRMRKQAA